MSDTEDLALMTNSSVERTYDAPSDEYIRQEAEWFADNKAHFWKAQAAVRDWVKNIGLIRLSDGRVVEMLPDGQEYDADALLMTVPSLVPTASVTLGGTTGEVSEVITAVTDLFPDVHIRSIVYEVDKLGAKHAVSAGGEVAEKVKAAMIPATKLGVRR